MFSLSQIIEWFSICVIVASVLGLMWLGGHIYFKVQNIRQQRKEEAPLPEGKADQEEKLVAWWRD